MCKLSETSEWWTSLSTSHDERIMTAITVRSKGKVQSNGKLQHEILYTLTDFKLGGTFQPINAR